jgi:hypothetical protein
MKSLFFLYLLALGVFGNKTYTQERNWWYEFNATEHRTKQTNIFFEALSDLPYVSLYISISEEYHNSSYQDGYRSWFTFTSPKYDDISIPYTSEILGSGYASRIGPCGFPNLISPPHVVDISHFQEIQNYTSQLQVLVNTTIELEYTQITSLPASSEFVCDGLQRFRTVTILPWDTYYYENKDFVLTLSTPLLTGDVSDYVSQVILWDEDKCNYWKPPFDISIPLNNGSSHTVTVPAKEIWYITFRTLRKLETINLDFMVVDRPGYYPPSPAFIPSLNLSVIGLLILTLFVYRQ